MKTYRFPNHTEPLTREQWLSEGEPEQRNGNATDENDPQISIFEEDKNVTVQP
jgi:hypothetical protein